MLRHIVIALFIIAAGSALWGVGVVERRTIASQRELLMMRYQASIDESAALEHATRFLPDAAVARQWRAGLRRLRDESRYWMHDYARLATHDDEAATRGADAVDPAIRLLITNGAYRRAAGHVHGASASQELDAIAGLYLEILKSDATLLDAAYNYEFVIRARNAGSAPDAQDPSIHGIPAVAPTSADTSDFKIIVPQVPDERRQEPDAGAGRAKARKG